MAIQINSPKGKGFAACEAGKPQTSNPYPAFDGDCSWDEWMEGWQQAFDMARFGINESRPRHQGEHMTDKQPDALRLADWLEADACDLQPPMDAAAELRRLHAENRRLRENDDRYTWLVDWLARTGLLTAQKCQITGSETYGDWWILRKPYMIDGNQLLGYGKTASDAIDSAIAKVEGEKA